MVESLFNDYSGRGGAKYGVVSTRAGRGGTRGRGFAPTGRGIPAQRIQVWHLAVFQALRYNTC